MTDATLTSDPPPPAIPAGCIALYCLNDGPSIEYGKPGASAAYAAVWPHVRRFDYSGPVLGKDSTDRRAELLSIIRFLRYADRVDPARVQKLVIVTDSSVSKRTLLEGAADWLVRGW